MQAYYYIMLGLAALVAAAYFIFSLTKSKVLFKLKVCAVCAAALVVSLAAGVGMHIVSLQRIQESVFPGFEYYITMVVFAALSYAGLRLFKLDTSVSGLIAVSLLIFSFVARFGCLIAGCCGGKNISGFTVPIVWIELLFAAACLSVLLAGRINYKAVPDIKYIFIYSVFRFITEFFRENYNIRQILFLNIRQYIALIVIVFYIASFAISKLSKKGAEKK